MLGVAAWMSDIALWCAPLKCKWLGLSTQVEINMAMGNLHSRTNFFHSGKLRSHHILTVQHSNLSLALTLDLIKKLLCSKFRNYEGKNHKP